MKRRETAPEPGQAELVLPRDLTEARNGLPAGDFSDFLAAQRAWLKEHGIDTTDYRRVLAIIRASKAHHGILDALGRAQERSHRSDTPLTP